jgi:cellulose synthase/poly-beta-1,6-N-acetylglucosamine synthase-like glycosyltransferase
MLSAVYLSAAALYAALDLLLLRGLKRLDRAGSNGNVTPAEAPPGVPAVTVLIAARDEERNLPRTLDALLAQDYPAGRMRIVVANDRSTDGTAALLRDYAARHPDRVEWVDVTASTPGLSPKKNALLHGLARARGEWIATTDADCVMGPGWLSALARHFAPGTGMVLGITSYLEPARGFTVGEGMQALNFESHSVTSAALVGLGFPVISNANNLAYRRQAFDEARAFELHGDVVSGDDDFILQEIHASGRWKIRFCTDAAALMRTNGPDDWRHYWEQHKRWASKCLHYRPRQVMFLMAVFAFYLSIPVLLIAGLWHAPLGLLGLAGFAAKTAADYAVMHVGLRRFGLFPLLRFFPMTALMHIPLVIAAVFAGLTGSFTWKGQKMGTKVPG